MDQRERLQRLAQQLAALQRLLFGSKSERVVVAPDPQQGALVASAAASGARADRGARREQQAQAAAPPWTSCRRTCPRKTIVIEPEEDVTGLVCIGTEKTQRLERVPSKLIVLEILRPKYVDPATGGDHRQGVWWTRAWPVRACWPTFWLASIAITCPVPAAAALPAGRRRACEVHAGRVDRAVGVAPGALVRGTEAGVTRKWVSAGG